MPQVKFANKKQRQKVVEIKDQNRALQLAMEMLAPVQQRMQASQTQMRETLELLGVPVDGRYVQINDGGDDPAAAGIWYEDETTKYDPQSEKWVPRSPEEAAAFCLRFPGSAPAASGEPPAA